ncbi:MAG: TonB family protein [Dysgonamonadaceae bacterium]|jgi:TonB family protein|nr:TonB family protein [Dysgonamonadaceae bacterium]
MELTREKTYGIIGSILFYIVLLLILYFTFLRTEIKAKEEGVLLHFGTVNLTAGTFTPKGEVNKAASQETNPDSPTQKIPEIPQPRSQEAPPIAQPKPQAKPQTKPTPPPITQNLEQTAAVEAAKQKQRENAAAEKAAAEKAIRDAAKAEQDRLEQEQSKRDAINRQVSGAFADNSGRGQQGTGQAGSGTQGNPQSAPTTVSSGGGYGEFSLGGRTLGSEGLPRPDYSASEEGNIVVNITVDPRGNVILAEIGKGTTINSVAMRKSALEAARKAKFSSINGNNNQLGTITYRYYLK